MAIFNSLTFDGINSLERGVYITGECVYNAPQRAIEMIAIPGRNGALALDQGRYENIEVTYPAGVFANSQPEYAEKLREFRNLLVSRYRYVKITDTYHPDEYRLGLYKSGLEVEPHRYSTAGEFSITFDCKPQRFLIEGDEPLDFYLDPEPWTDHNGNEMTDHGGNVFYFAQMGASIENPTENESKPLLVVPRAGTVQFGNQNVTITGSGYPVYIDCDTMEVYTKNSSGAVSSASDRVSFVPNAFPTIPSGESTFFTSIADLQIIPRWWVL